MRVVALDLEHRGLPGSITSYLVHGREPAVVDPGPASTLDALEARLAVEGLALDDVAHVALTHVHLDHAGSTGHLARRVPEIRVHVHEEGAPHLADPRRLVVSTRRTFGEAHDALWGEVLPVPEGRIRAWRPGERSGVARLHPVPTPGHIDHHVAWLDEEEGTLLAGDAMGLILAPDAPTHPATPPPGVDVDAWYRSLDRVRDLGAGRVGVAHAGLHGDVPGRADALEAALRGLVQRAAEALDAGREEEDAEAWEEEARARQARARSREEVDRYFDVFRAATDYRGVVRALRKGRADPEREPTDERRE